MLSDGTRCAISPDGRWIAYRSDESGRFEVYVRLFPNVEAGRWQISSSGGWHPGWSHDGRQLYFQTLANDVMSVAVASGQTFTASAAVRLFGTDGYYAAPNARSYDIGRDGRFLMVKNLQQKDARYAVVVENWLDEVKAGTSDVERAKRP